MFSSSETFHALTMFRRESGFCFSISSAWEIWSMWRPSGVGQLRHCTP